MLVCAGTTNHQLMSTDLPAITVAAHGGFIRGPQRKTCAVIKQKMQSLNIGSGVRFVITNGRELWAEQVLSSAVAFQRPPYVVHPDIATVKGLCAKPNHLNIVAEAGRIAFPVALIDTSGIAKHDVL